MTFPFPFFIPAGEGLAASDFTITDFGGQNLGGASSHTFTNVDFGPEPGPGEKRYIAAAIAPVQNANRSITAVTIGGVAATPIVARPGTSVPAGIYVAEVPSGETGNIAITFSGSIATCGFVACRLINPLDPSGFATAADSHTSGNCNLTLDIPYGGLALAVTNSQNAAPISWRGLTVLTNQDFNSDEWFSAAFGSDQGSPTIIIGDNNDNSPREYGGVAASWAPAILKAAVEITQGIYNKRDLIFAEIPTDNTIPQISEGFELAQVKIKPSSPNAKLLILVSVNATPRRYLAANNQTDELVGFSETEAVAVALFRGSTCINAVAGVTLTDDFNSSYSISMIDEPGTTNDVTYTLRVGGGRHFEGGSIGVPPGPAIRVNGRWSMFDDVGPENEDDLIDIGFFGGLGRATLIVMEL